MANPYIAEQQGSVMASTNPNRQATILDDAYDLIGDKAQMVAILVKEIIAQVIDKHDR